MRACLSWRWTAENLLLPLYVRILHRIRGVSTHDFVFPNVSCRAFGRLGIRAIKFILKFIAEFFSSHPFTAPAKCAHQTPRIPCGVIASACSPMALSAEYWRPIEWFRGRAFKSARMTESSSTSRITWRAWKLHFTGTAFGNVALSTTMACHL